MSAKLGRGVLAPMTLYVEVAFGADLTDTTGAGWVWTDITTDVRMTPGISTKLGRADEASAPQPAEFKATLGNSSGDYSLGGASRRWPYIRLGTPVRMRIDPGTGAGPQVVFLGSATSWSPTWDGLGKIPTVKLTASGTLRRLKQGASALPSTFRRAMTALSTVSAYWPLEEGKEATYAPAVRGGSNLVFSGVPKFANTNDLVASGPLPTAGTGAFICQVDPYTDTGANCVRLLIDMPSGGMPDGTVLAHIYTTGSIGRFDVTYELSPGPCLGWFAYNSNGTLNTSSINGQPTLDGLQGRISIEISQVAGNVSWKVAIVDQTPGAAIVSNSPDVMAGTCGIVKQIELFPDGTGNTIGFGHLTVENVITSLATDRAAMQAFYGEFPSSSTAGVSRITRLLTENGLALTRFTDLTTPSDNLNVREEMSYQPKATLLTALVECENADRGQLWDGRTVGLSFTTRRYRDRAGTVLTLDASAAELAEPFGPDYDDQRAVNQAEVTRTLGVTSSYADTTGPLGTVAIGVYDTSETISGVSDMMALQHAAWIVSLGTVDGYRYPTVTVNLRNSPTHAAEVLALVPGDRVSVTSPNLALLGFPTGTVDLLVEGIAHDVGEDDWTVELNCSPALPWMVARVAADVGDTSEFLARPDTSGASLAAAASKLATSLSVSTPAGPLWTTAADDFPLTLDVGGVPVVATACSGASSPQTFTVQPLAYDRASGTAVKLWAERPLGL